MELLSRFASITMWVPIDVVSISAPSSPTDVAFFLATLGALLLFFSIPLWQVWVKRNRVYGIRTPAALESDENWRVVNRYAGGQGVRAAGGLLGLSPLCRIFAPDHMSQNSYEALVAIPLLVAVGWIARSAMAAERLLPGR